eukprot:gene9868-6939_t
MDHKLMNVRNIVVGCFSACLAGLRSENAWCEEGDPKPHLGPQPPQDNRNEEGNVRKSPRGHGATADMKKRTARRAHSAAAPRHQPPPEGRATGGAPFRLGAKLVADGAFHSKRKSLRPS